MKPEKNELMQSNLSESSTIDKKNSYEKSRQSTLISVCQILRTVISKMENSVKYQEMRKNQKTNSFSLSKVPEISIEDYLYRILYYSKIEKCTLIIALIYIDRICSLSHITLTMYNIHRLIFVSILVSIKFNEDKHFKLCEYSKISGISVKKIFKLEREFLLLLQYNLYVDEDLYSRYSSYIFQKN